MSNDSKRVSDKDITERTLVKVREYTQFLCEVVAEHYTIMCKYPPSKVANACFYLARRCCNLRSVWSFDLEEYSGYSETALRDILSDINESCHDIKALIDYARNNCREGSRADYLNQLKFQFKGPVVGRQRWNLEKPAVSKWVEHSYNVFDNFLRARGLDDPYKSCTINKRKPAKQSTALHALTLHSAPQGSFVISQQDVHEVVEDAIFCELSSASNTATKEVIMPTPKAERKTPTDPEAGPQVSSHDRHEKENWDELTEKI